uniref:5-hmdU DNA kinase helical domain-containing protein n=1 Tax=Chromera velia CCMP2878 TaxID=1169474 RepID=A0A0G4HQ09_9ALVE|eukprot:Cvel_7849.t1-p1 / transcript=Cvel_7849.t1 / gene=Cvel_7849 / organism=Chromera_velia_CCMP2878 / gene_product=hypothetical protein / transcript_product=hypothetical protein / location=Cvel_scaffold420:24952-29541(-) / protein_length=592 / sequence_SO=supercontig / SO=protein_coding / is_pseudo=false
MNAVSQRLLLPLFCLLIVSQTARAGPSSLAPLSGSFIRMASLSLSPFAWLSTGRKPHDMVRCGCRAAEIESRRLSKRPDFFDKVNFEGMRLLHLFITERHSVYKKKTLLKLPPPWTEDRVIGSYRFTNVRRELDRETQWLLRHVCRNDDITYEAKLANCILFRAFSKHQSFEAVGPFQTVDDILQFPLEESRRRFGALKEKTKAAPLFTAAFNTGGLRNSWREAESCDGTRMVLMVQTMVKSGVLERLHLCSNQAQVFELLASYRGIGRFLAYQMFVDFSYIPEFPFSDREFTVAGPGALAGLRELFGEHPREETGLSAEELIFWLEDNFGDCCEKLGLQWNPDSLFEDSPSTDRRLNVMMLENCLCELSKLARGKREKGGPKQRYRQSAEPLAMFSAEDRDLPFPPAAPQPNGDLQAGVPVEGGRYDTAAEEGDEEVLNSLMSGAAAPFERQGSADVGLRTGVRVSEKAEEETVGDAAAPSSSSSASGREKRKNVSTVQPQENRGEAMQLPSEGQTGGMRKSSRRRAHVTGSSVSMFEGVWPEARYADTERETLAERASWSLERGGTKRKGGAGQGEEQKGALVSKMKRTE